MERAHPMPRSDRYDDEAPGGEVDCSVLVPMLNEEAHIDRAVAAMQGQRFHGTLEFLLVDGGSTDRTREIVRRLAREDPRIRLLDNPRHVTPSALNIALGHARGRWVARMDAHSEYAPEYLAVGIERLSRGDTRWVSGPTIAVGAGAVSRTVALALKSRLGRGGSRKWADGESPSQSENELDAGVFSGVWARATLLEYGGWDERWIRNQDSEMAGRFIARGERLIGTSRMTARYTPRDSLTGLWRQYVEYGEYREMTAVRHPHTMRRSHLLAPGIVLTAALSVLGPRRLRRLARHGFAAYALVLAAASLRGLSAAEHPSDAALLPLVLATMHFGHGAGMIRGALRHGPPLAALASMAGLHSPDPAGWTSEDVFAPSLQEALAHQP